jgi:hypothetical protein
LAKWVRFVRFARLVCAPDMAQSGTFWHIAKKPRGVAQRSAGDVQIVERLLMHDGSPPNGSIVRQFDASRARHPRDASETQKIAAVSRKSFCARGVELAHDGARRRPARHSHSSPKVRDFPAAAKVAGGSWNGHFGAVVFRPPRMLPTGESSPTRLFSHARGFFMR